MRNTEGGKKGAKARHLLNLLVVLSTTSAIIVVGSRVRAEWLTPPREIEVREWRRLGEVGNRLGSANAPVTIVVFSDYACPFSDKLAPVLQAIRQEFPEKVAVVHRHWPLKEGSKDAAVAAECAGQMGMFEAYDSALLARQEEIKAGPWMGIARGIGIADTLRFRACMMDSAVLQVVERDIRDAETLDSTPATPTILVNEKMIRGYLDLPELRRYVSAALNAR